MALYQKKYVTRSTIYMESFILVSQSAQFSHYAALLLGLKGPITTDIVVIYPEPSGKKMLHGTTYLLPNYIMIHHFGRSGT